MIFERIRSNLLYSLPQQQQGLDENQIILRLVAALYQIHDKNFHFAEGLFIIWQRLLNGSNESLPIYDNIMVYVLPQNTPARL